MKFAKWLLAGAMALALAAAGLATQWTAFNLIWTDNIGDGDWSLPPVPIMLGIDTTMTNNYDVGEAEVPPAPPTPWVQLVSYTDDSVACVEEYRPGTVGSSPGLLDLYYYGEMIPTGWAVNKKAGTSWLSWTGIDKWTGYPDHYGWVTLTLTIDETTSYDMLTTSQVAVTVQRTLGPFWEITGTYHTPEPGTAMLLGTGLAGLIALARKR